MDQIQPERKPINEIFITLSEVLGSGMTEMSMDELTFAVFAQTQDRYFEPINYSIGVLSNEAPEKYKDVIFKLREVLPEWAK